MYLVRPPSSQHTLSTTKNHNNMTLKGQHLELLPVDSPEYKKHINKVKDLHLINLYKIHYTGADKNNNSDDSWSDPIYFHGTGHCGCIDRHIERRTGSVRISVSEWCQHDDACETRGILLQGHCREHSLHEGMKVNIQNPLFP